MSRRITALNNKGVESLENGRFQEAILSFRHAISCVEQAVEGPATPCDDIVCDNEYIAVIGSTLDCLNASTVVAVSPHNMFEMYQAAFLLPRFDTPVDKLASEISAVLFYNLALAHHYVALSGSEEGSRHFMEALRFYKLAFTVLKSTSDCKLDGISLVMGLLNNLAHIFSHFWRAEEAKACMNRLENLLSTSVVMELSDEDGEFFFSTTAHNIAYLCNLAPAA